MKADKAPSANLRATIFDVAHHAGVSIKTVSRVVNNEPNVRDVTRERVRASIEALQYRPNAAARGLSGKRSYVIGLVYENSEEFSYTKDLLTGVLRACDTHGYSLLLRPLTLPSREAGKIVESFVRLTGADALVLPAPMGDMPEVTEVPTRLGLPVAAISPKQPSDHEISVVCDEAEATYTLTEHLIAQGHQRIGFIKGHPDHRASEERLRGYTEALDARKIGAHPSLLEEGLFTFESGHQAAMRLLQRQHAPTAIVASNDETACGAMHAALELGLGIPRDLSIVGFDDTAVAARLWPPLTTVRQPIIDMAETATNLLVERLRGDATQAPTASFACQVVVRESTKAPSN